MEEWKRKLDADLDVLVDVYDRIDTEIVMLGGEVPSPELASYVENLAKRYEQLIQPANAVAELPGSIYRISNYDLKMYKWFIGRQFQSGVITPRSLCVEQGDLTPDERKQFQERLHKA